MYYTIQDNNLLISENEEALTRYYVNVSTLPVDYKEGKYVIDNGELVINTEFEAQEQAQEQARISMLSLTAADVERGIYKATGMDFDDIIAKVTEIATAEPRNDDSGEASTTAEGEEIATGDALAMTIDIKALKIELKANNFYRGNPYVDAVGTLLGFTKEQLDAFFEDGNYEHLLEQEIASA